MRVLLVPDHPGWAFDHRAKDLMGLGMADIRFDLKYLPDVTAGDCRKYDLVYPMSLSIARKLNDAGVALNKMAAGVTSVRVFEKQLDENRRFKPEFARFVRQLRGVNAWSDEIVRLFRPRFRMFKTRIGIDHRLFSPAPKRKRNRVFTVGWVGNIDRPSYRELKGYDIVLVALKGLDVRLDVRSFRGRYVPRKRMPDFYRSLDCFICSSRSEGLPNPVLEAAACGVPIITTKVGIVPELIRHRKNGIIVPRTAEAIRRETMRLKGDPEMRDQLSRNIRKTVERHWTWDLCKKDWEHFFKSMVEAGKNR